MAKPWRLTNSNYCYSAAEKQSRKVSYICHPCGKTAVAYRGFWFGVPPVVRCKKCKRKMAVAYGV